MADNKLNYTLSLKDLFSKKLGGAEASVKRLDGGMSKLSGTANKLGGMIAGAFAVGSIVSFGKSILESLKNYEYFTASIKTMLNGDAQAAKALQGQLIDLAKTTPFSLTDVQTATKQLLAYGFKAGDLVKEMRTLGDVSAGVGAPLGDIAYLYGTLKTSGRVMQVDLRQFAGRGIPIYEELAKVLKVNTAEVNKMVHDGKVGFKDVQTAFRNMTAEGGHFFNLMSDQSKTVGGRLSNLGDVWEQLKINIGKSQTGIINGTVSWVSEMVSKLNDVAAAANRLDSAFKTAKVDGYSMMQNFNNWLFAGTTNKFVNDQFTGGKGKMEMLDRSAQSMYVDPSKRDKVSALGSNADILKLMSGLSKSFINKDIGKLEYDRSYAILKAAQGEVLGNIKLFDTKADPNKLDPTGATKDGAAAHSSGPGTEVSGSRPQNLYITINDGLVKQMNVYATTIKESTVQIKKMIGETLMEAVNDVNQSGAQ